MEKLLTPSEAASLLHVSTNCLRQWERKGKIKAVKTLGRHRRYSKEDIDAILRSQEKSSA